MISKPKPTPKAKTASQDNLQKQFHSFGEWELAVRDWVCSGGGSTHQAQAAIEELKKPFFKFDRYKFTLQNRKQAVEFHEAYSDLKWRLHEAREELLNSQRPWLDYQPDDDFDDFDPRPSAEIQMFADRLEVLAYRKGVGDRLPKRFGRKYVGDVNDVRWRFTLEALEELKKLGFPILQAEVALD